MRGLCNAVRFVTCKADEMNELARLRMGNGRGVRWEKGESDESDRSRWASCGFGGVWCCTSRQFWHWPMEAPKTAANAPFHFRVLVRKWRGGRREAAGKRGLLVLQCISRRDSPLFAPERPLLIC